MYTMNALECPDCKIVVVSGYSHQCGSYNNVITWNGLVDRFQARGQRNIQEILQKVIGDINKLKERMEILEAKIIL